MKKILSIIFCMVMMFHIGNAVAACNRKCAVNAFTDEWAWQCPNTINNCDMSGCPTGVKVPCDDPQDSNCVNGYKFGIDSNNPTCVRCADGYDTQLMGLSNCYVDYSSDESETDLCYIEIYSCRLCTGCPSCTSDPNWTDVVIGYQKRTVRTCRCETCDTSIEYKCADGYQGTPTGCPDNCTGCVATKCPAGYYGTNDVVIGCRPCSEKHSTATSDEGSEHATECYIQPPLSGSDYSGSFELSAKCFYTG
jgi:hypothetical protein